MLNSYQHSVLLQQGVRVRKSHTYLHWNRKENKNRKYIFEAIIWFIFIGCMCLVP